MTQAELAKMIKYSDKAISRWETGDVIPDLSTIYTLSEVFGVPVSSITEKPREDENIDKRSSHVSRTILSQFFLVCEIWFILCAVFVFFKITRQMNIWPIFVWGVPATAMALWFANRKEQRNVLLFVLATVFVWSFITCVYLHLVYSNPWYMFFLGLPLQGLLIMRYVFNYKQNLKKLRIRRKKGDGQDQP